jgi:hypothetical protein
MTEEQEMTYANPTRRWTQRLAFVVTTAIVGAGTLEVLAHAMKFPDPAATAARQQMLAAQSAQAGRLRSLPVRDVRLAAVRLPDRI